MHILFNKKYKDFIFIFYIYKIFNILYLDKLFILYTIFSQIFKFINLN